MSDSKLTFRLLTAAVLVCLASIGCGPDEPGDGSSGGPDGGEVADRSCGPDASGACRCDYQGTSKGVCADQRIGPGGTCYKPEAFESTESKCADGLDNDCDGDADCADSDCTGATCGLGQGTAQCVGGECKEKVCHDGQDNDEDGETDCADADCTREICAEGTERTCPPPEAWEPQEQQTCDGTDNDCDGATDEGCSCTFDPGEEDKVDTDDTHGDGVCTEQTRDAQGVCQRPGAFEMRTGSESSCEGVDNDCDGATDEGCDCTFDPGEDDKVDTDDTHGDGVCTGQTRDAQGVCKEPNSFEMETDAESNCDDNDNDCDGVVDEGCSCTYDPNETDGVDTDGSHADGVCLNQTRDASGVCQEPSTFGTSEIEACSPGKDDDCDGQTDEESAVHPGGSCSRDCECTTGVCRGGVCGHLIFVSSKTYTGDLGGISTADKRCDAMARQAGLPDTANWYALVAEDHLTGPYSRVIVAEAVERVDGVKVADGPGDLWDGDIDNAVNVDETGMTVSSERVWTGSNSDGKSAGKSDGDGTCNSWTDGSSSLTGRYGRTSTTGSGWISESNISCIANYRIYCINAP